MADRNLAYNPLTKVARILPSATAMPAGFTNAGVIHHEDPNDNHIKFAVSHTLFQHVQERLYKQFSVQDMASVTIFGGLAAADPVRIE